MTEKRTDAPQAPRRSVWIPTVGAVAGCVVMVSFPELTGTACKEAICLWLNAVVPALLPFFIAAGFLQRTGLAAKLPPRLYPLVMALLSGYPMGARIAGDARRAGRLEQGSLYHVLAYSMVTGPAFLVGAVGAGFLHSHALGILLAISHYAGAWLNGWLYRDTGGPGESGRRTAAPPLCSPGLPPRAAGTAGSLYDGLTDAILDSFRSIAIILAYLILFMIAGDLLQFSGVLRLLPTPELAALAKGCLEMTVGADSLAHCPCSLAVKTAWISFVVSFGGLSVLGQSMSMLRGCGVSFRRLLCIKLSHGVLSGLLALSLLMLWGAR